MNPTQVYMCSPPWTLLPPPSPSHPSGSSQCTSPKHPVSCIEPGLATRFIHDILHVSMPFSQIFPPFPSPTESYLLFFKILAALGLQHGMWTFFSCDAWIFLVAEHRWALQCEHSVVVAHRLSSCVAQALECTGSLVVVHRFSCPVACKILISWPGIEPMCPALEGRLLTTGPSGKS